MALICKERFEQRKIDNLLQYLKLYADKGQGIDYEIIVDGFKAVRRTNDLDMFSLYENFVTGDSRYMEILLYNGSSNNNDKRIFYFGEEVKEVQAHEGLSGVDVQHMIQEGIQKATREKEFEALQLENKDLLHDVRELEKEVEELQQQKAALEARLSPLNAVLGDVGANIAESFLRRNPKVMAAIPGGEALAGFLGNPATETQATSTEAHVTFKAKSDTEASDEHTTQANTLNVEQQSAILFVDQLKGQFTQAEFKKVLIVLQALVDDKNLLEELSSKYQAESSKT